MGGKQNSSTFKVFQGAYEPCNEFDLPDIIFDLPEIS